MKFKIVDEYRYWWPIKVKLPDPSNSGKILTQTFEMEFEALPDEESRELAAQIKALPVDDSAEDQHLILRRVAKGWRGLDGDLPFNEANFALASRWPWFRKAVLDAYRQSTMGEVARQGN